MRFRLVEKAYLTEEGMFDGNRVEGVLRDSKDKDTVLKMAINQGVLGEINKRIASEEFKDVRRVLQQSLLDNGSGAGNKFLQYFKHASNVISPNDSGKMSIMRDMIDSSVINYDKISSDIWENKSLYKNRKDDEFEYTVKIINIASDSETAEKYYRNVDSIDVDDLKIGSSIKDSGLYSHKENTIWDQVERWSEFEKKEFDEEDKKYSINDLYRYKNIKADSIPEKISELVNILQREKVFDTDKISKVMLYLNDEENSKYTKRLFDIKGMDSLEDGELSKFIKVEFKL